MPIYTNILKGKKTLGQFRIWCPRGCDLTMSLQLDHNPLPNMKLNISTICANWQFHGVLCLKELLFQASKHHFFFPQKCIHPFLKWGPFQKLRNHGRWLPKCHLKWCLPGVRMSSSVVWPFIPHRIFSPRVRFSMNKRVQIVLNNHVITSF